MKIKLISDIICPWCYVGKRRLEQAIADLGFQDKVQIEISPYELYADTWPEGRSTDGYKNKGDVLPVLREAGEALGIDFKFERITKIPNTLRLHGYLMSVQDEDRRLLKEAFLNAFFTLGRDLTNDTTVRQVFQDTLGRPADDLSEVAIEQVSKAIAENRALGVRAVPSFVINDEHILSGAIEAGRWSQFLSKNIT